MLQEVTRESLAGFLAQARVALLKFGAPWCVACHRADPALEALAEGYAGQAVFGEVNIDEEPELARCFEVMSLPTVAVFRDGELAQQFPYRSKRGTEEILDCLLGPS